MRHLVATLEELEQQRQICRAVGGVKLLLLHTEDGIYALENRCTHAEFPLAGGRVEAGSIRCPAHGARFNLATGEPCEGGRLKAVATYPVAVVDGMVEVTIA